MRSLTQLLVAALLAASTFVLSVSSPALAARKCWFDENTLRERCRITAEPGGPEMTVPFDGIPITWVRWNGGVNGFLEYGYAACERDGIVEGLSTRIVGIIWIVSLVNTETGELISMNGVCEYPGEDPPKPPPPPPTPAEYVEAIEALLEVNFELSPPPAFEGITGVDTWFWCTTPEPAVIAPITLRGWTVEAEMSAILFSWTVSGPGLGGSHDSETCGAEPALDSDGEGAAWVWQPQTMGEYTINFTSTWLGTWTQTYNGVNVGTFPLGPAPIAQAPLTYPVGEYVGVLVPGGDE